MSFNQLPSPQTSSSQNALGRHNIMCVRFVYCLPGLKTEENKEEGGEVCQWRGIKT